MVRERAYEGIHGLPVLVVLLLALLAIIPFARVGISAGQSGVKGARVFFLFLPAYAMPILVFFAFTGFFMVAPNQARVLQLFGSYVGTAKTPGLRWANPFFKKTKISLRVRNFESSQLKVNDQDGNPIEIAAVVVWRVVETAEAVFEVDDYENYVKVQSEAALRNASTSYPYDSHDDHVVSLRGSTGAVAEHLKRRFNSGWRRRGSRSSRRVSATWPTPRRLPRRCCSGSRPVRSSPPAS